MAWSDAARAAAAEARRRRHIDIHSPMQGGGTPQPIDRKQMAARLKQGRKAAKTYYATKAKSSSPARINSMALTRARIASFGYEGRISGHAAVYAVPKPSKYIGKTRMLASSRSPFGVGPKVGGGVVFTSKK